MATRMHPTFVKGLTIAVALTLMSGFVFYRHRGGSPSPDTIATTPPVDGPETEGAMKQVRIDSFYMDQSMPSSKSGMIVPPDHPAFREVPAQQRVQTGPERATFSSSKSLTPLIVLPPLTMRDSFMLQQHSNDTLN